jgi:hypothetical protein
MFDLNHIFWISNWKGENTGGVLSKHGATNAGVNSQNMPSQLRHI